MKKLRRNILIAVGIGLTIYLVGFGHLSAQSLPDGFTVAQRTDERNEGEHVMQTLTMELIDKRGKKRKRVTTAYRRYFGKERRQSIFYRDPSNIKGTAFLVYDYPEKGKDNDQWLYLPALRKTRRISASNRGDYFLGTDMTYEDINLGNKLSIEDYTYETLKQEVIDGFECYLIEGTPVDEKTAKELGYSKIQAWVDVNNAMIRKGEYWDIAGNHLKSLRTTEIKKVDNIWTGHTLHVANHKTGHATYFYFSDVDYKTDVSEEIFTEQALVRGI